MYAPALYTNPDGTIDEAKKAKVLKDDIRYSDKSRRNMRRINIVTEKIKPENYFNTDVYIKSMKDIPTILYESNNGLYNLIDYLNQLLEHLTGKSYPYSEHKKTVTEFVKYFNIKPYQSNFKEKEKFQDETENFYSHKILWFYLCRWCLKQEKKIS